jgi:sensor domain CHASE-containing protein
MKIRGKVLSAIAFSLLATALANFFVLKTLVFPTFLELEQQAAARDMQRVLEAINSEIEDVDKTLWDYSSWDDSYRYAKGGYKSYPVSNLAVETLQNLRLDIVEIYDAKKTRLFTVVYDRNAGRTRQAEWKLTALADGSLLTHTDDASTISGILSTPDRPALFASRPIVKTNGEGPAVGTFILGRFIDDDLVASIKDHIKVDFALTPIEGLSGTADVAYQHLLRSDEPVLTQETPDDQLLAYSLIKDVRGRPILLATAKVRRDISQIGQRVLSASVGGLALTAILVMAVLTVLLQWLLVGPLVSLTRHVVEIQAEGTPERRIGLPRRDEIGILAREFDRMLARLAEARDRLLDHSYQSGVAHMASGVLHNLRNQLMPVNTRVERLRERVIERTDKHVDAAFAEFASEQTTADRRSKISTYLALSFDKLRDAQTEVGGQLALVLQDLLRVEDVLGDLDRFSRVGSSIQPVSVAACVQDAIAMVPSFPDIEVEVDVDPLVKEQPTVASARFILKHVLQNLFVNAIEAVAAAGGTTAKIDVLASPRTVDGVQYVDLQVRDNGIGIHPDQLASIFVRGFSTKTQARRGAGLHWCANSISAISGRIYAESAGHNQGSTFHILLRIAE